MVYSAKFKQRMISKLTGPGACSASSLAKEAGVPQSTLSRWLRDAKIPPMTKQKKTGSRRRRSPEDKVRVVMAAAAIGEDQLGAFLRREGLFEADLTRIREEVEEAATEGLRARGKRGISPEAKENARLRKELNRKEKALAEAAALLVLRGKLDAFLSAEEEGDMDDRSDRRS